MLSRPNQARKLFASLLITSSFHTLRVLDLLDVPLAIFLSILK